MIKYYHLSNYCDIFICIHIMLGNTRINFPFYVIKIAIRKIKIVSKKNDSKNFKVETPLNVKGKNHMIL